MFILPQALFSIPEQYFPILYASAGVISKLLLFLTMQLTKRIIDQQSMNYVSKSQWLFATFMSVCTFSVTGLAGSIDADVPDEIIPMVFIAAIALLVLTAILFFNMCDLASKSRKLHEESPAPTSDHRAAPDVSAHHGGYRAVEKDILFVYQLVALSELSLEPQDLVSLLSNLLSNAIEACEKIDGNRYIKIKLVPEDGQLVLSLHNSYNGVVRYIDGELVTTKTEHPTIHGLGMKNVRQVIEKYNGYCAIRPGETEFYIAVIIPLESVPFLHLSNEPGK